LLLEEGFEVLVQVYADRFLEEIALLVQLVQDEDLDVWEIARSRGRDAGLLRGCMKADDALLGRHLAC